MGKSVPFKLQDHKTMRSQEARKLIGSNHRRNAPKYAEMCLEGDLVSHFLFFALSHALTHDMLWNTRKLVRMYFIINRVVMVMILFSFSSRTEHIYRACLATYGLVWSRGLERKKKNVEEGVLLQLLLVPFLSLLHNYTCSSA